MRRFSLSSSGLWSCKRKGGVTFKGGYREKLPGRPGRSFPAVVKLPHLGDGEGRATLPAQDATRVADVGDGKFVVLDEGDDGSGAVAQSLASGDLDELGLALVEARD